jgi:hypothetical protein
MFTPNQVRNPNDEGILFGCVSNDLNQGLTGFQMALFCHKPVCARHADILSAL